MTKKFILFLISFALLISANTAFAYAPKAPNIKGTVFNPKVSGYKYINLHQIKGKKLIIVNFFATWCPPCRAEIPGLVSFYNKNKKNILIIGVDVNVTKNGVSNFVKTFDGGITYPVVHTNAMEIENYGGINFIPQSFLVNQYGKIIFHWQGPMTTQMLNVIKKKMGIK
jgi:thiol-disulfide isomerase/thioredoxin